MQGGQVLRLVPVLPVNEAYEQYTLTGASAAVTKGAAQRRRRALIGGLRGWRRRGR